MTRIGFAYNQKPDLSAGLVEATHSEVGRPEEEPPSTRRDSESRIIHHPGSHADDARAQTVAVAVDDAYAEWDSPETIDAVAHALSAYGDVIRLEATPAFPEQLRAARPDIVFNIAEGLHGPNRESHVPAICEFFDVPYSGSDPFTLSLCLHKARTKEFLSVRGIRTAPFTLIESENDLADYLAGKPARLPWPSASAPVFLKPVQEGSSKGITERNFVRSREELDEQCRFLLETYAQPVIAESFLPGAEFTCGVLGNGPAARMLPPVAIDFRSLPEGALPIYGFEAKWVWDTPDQPLDIFECPARIDTRLHSAIEDVVLHAYRALGCRDWARIDVRLDADGVPNIVEVNPLPGILPKPEDNSCLPKAARAAGLSYDELIQACLVHAAARTGVRLAMGDGRWAMGGNDVTPIAHRPSSIAGSTRPSPAV
jgi:D-alanine-D-alanine ligase